MKKFLLILVPALLLIGCSESPIDIVKNGMLEMDSSLTVGDAFNNYQYFSDTSWVTFEDPQNRTVVEFNGVLDFDKFVGVSVDQLNITVTAENVKNLREKIKDIKIIYIAQFAISKYDDTFDLSVSAIDFSGRDVKTDETMSKKIPDSFLNALRNIYSNTPELVTAGLLSKS